MNDLHPLTHLLILLLVLIGALTLAVVIVLHVRGAVNVYEECMRRTGALEVAPCRDLKPW